MSADPPLQSASKPNPMQWLANTVNKVRSNTLSGDKSKQANSSTNSSALTSVAKDAVPNDSKSSGDFWKRHKMKRAKPGRITKTPVTNTKRLPGGQPNHPSAAQAVTAPVKSEDGDEEESMYTTPTEERLRDAKISSNSPTSSTADATTNDVERSPSSRELETERTMKKTARLLRMVEDSSMNMAKLRSTAWSGLPEAARAVSWKLLLGYLPANLTRREQTLRRRRAEYTAYVKEYYDLPDQQKSEAERKILRQIKLDVPRTCQKMSLFQDERIQSMLTRLLYVWSIRHTASGYVQGINDLATPFLVVFLLDGMNWHSQDHDVVEDGKNDRPWESYELPEDADTVVLESVEADTFMCMTQLLNGIQDHYTHAQPGIQTKVFKLSELIKRIDMALFLHLEAQNVPFMHFAYRWMNCLLMREFSLPLVIRVWDTYLSEENSGGFRDFHVYVCAAFLMHFAPQLKQYEFQDLVIFLQHLPTESWQDKDVESLLSQAFIYKSLFENAQAHLN